ncbi:MAG TPA: hypothetical protein VGI39_41770 [Polyangiaceae bacterium]|jgi:MFS family permease
MSKAPYRALAEGDRSNLPPAEHLYVAHERDVNAAFHRAWITGLFGVGFGACLAQAAAPAVGGVFVAGTIATAVWRWRRSRKGEAFVLRVADGVLSVQQRGVAALLVDGLPLVALRDVALDTRAIQPVMRDTNIAAVAAETTVRGEVDIARIVVVPERGEPMPLTGERVAHMDAVEGLAKIRTFLRKQGWVPESEREDPGG